MNQIDLAIRVMSTAHEGKKDKTGSPEALHPLAVGMMGTSEAEMAVGFLHDVLEDSDLTARDLLKEGISPEYVKSVSILTRDKSVSYFDYIRSVRDSRDKAAIQVKINDLTHNIRRGTEANLDSLVARHVKALKILLEPSVCRREP